MSSLCSMKLAPCPPPHICTTWNFPMNFHYPWTRSVLPSCSSVPELSLVFWATVSLLSSKLWPFLRAAVSSVSKRLSPFLQYVLLPGLPLFSLSCLWFSELYSLSILLNWVCYQELSRLRFRKPWTFSYTVKKLDEIQHFDTVRYLCFTWASCLCLLSLNCKSPFPLTVSLSWTFSVFYMSYICWVLPELPLSNFAAFFILSCFLQFCSP